MINRILLALEPCLFLGFLILLLNWVFSSDPISGWWWFGLLIGGIFLAECNSQHFSMN